MIQYETDLNVRALARIVSAVRFDDLPTTVVERAVRILVDTLAVSIAGAPDPFCRQYLAALAGSSSGPAASTIASPNPLPAELAALANALPTTVLQIDEGHRTSGGHPGIHVVPAALAVAEEVDADGAGLLEAVVAGYEAAARIGLALRPLPAGVHPNGTAGTFGAAVAAARLMGADEAAIRAVLDAVASLPFRPRLEAVFEGSTVLHLYAALGALNGVAIARAVVAGATCGEGAFDRYYLPAFSAGGRDWDAPGFEIERSYFKFYPACAHTHTSIEALEEVLATRTLDPDDVERIEVATFAIAAALREPRPASDLAARFSIPFCLARRLLAGPFDNRVFSARELADPDTLALAARVTLTVDPTLDRGYPSGRPVRLAVVLRDGTVLSSERRLPRGDYERPESEESWRQKLADLIGPARAQRLLAFADADPRGWTARQVGMAIRATAVHER